MKITPANADPRAFPHGLKDVQFRVTRWGFVAQKRPGKRRKPASKLQQQYRQRFAFAARMAANPIALDRLTAIEMAKDTQQTWRDVLTMAATGDYYVLENEDGTQWTKAPGPVIPLELGEEPAPPERPQDEDAPEMNFNHWDAAYTTPNSTSGYAFKGARFTPLEARSVTHVGAILNVSAAGSYRAALGTIGASNSLATVTLSAPIVGAYTDTQIMTWPLEVDLEAGKEHFLMIGRTDQGPTFSLPVWFSVSARWLWPCRRGGAALLASTEPTVGDTLALTSSSANPPLGLRFA